MISDQLQLHIHGVLMVVIITRHRHLAAKTFSRLFPLLYHTNRVVSKVLYTDLSATMNSRSYFFLMVVRLIQSYQVVHLIHALATIWLLVMMVS
jgi:hypothetical protein